MTYPQMNLNRPYQHRMQIHTVHVVPLDFVEVVELRLRWRHPLELHVEFMDAAFDFLGLVVEQTELGHVPGWVLAGVIVTKLSYQTENSAKSESCCSDAQIGLSPSYLARHKHRALRLVRKTPATGPGGCPA